MVKKIIISRFNNIGAILQNNKVQELIIVNNAYQVNDIYIGIVQKIFSSINAAFIKLSHNGKSGFIHANDIKTSKKKKNDVLITEILSINQLILVQIIKEPTNNKGPRLTTNITLTGQYIVLMPFCNNVCVSDKIHDQNERIHLHSLGILIKPSGMGLLIRSSAQGISEGIIIEDVRCLKKQWNFIEKAALYRYLPSLLYKEEDLINKIMSHFHDQNIRTIIVDSKKSLQQITQYLEKWKCNLSREQTKLQLYSKPEYLLDKFYINHAILDALKPKIHLVSGGHIIIEKNEALTVIDVNSGSFNKSDNSRETILRTNFYAATEIAYQLKIRNINGVIIIDFIDMESTKDQLKLLKHLSKLLQNDNARPQIIQLSELGLVELTRRRRGQSLDELFLSKNHHYLNLSTNFTFRHSYYEADNKLENTAAIYQYKNIRSLFFTRRFKKNIHLKHKKFMNNHDQKYKSLVYIDKKNTIHLIQPHKNYIVPLILYSKLIKIEENKIKRLI